MAYSLFKSETNWNYVKDVMWRYIYIYVYIYVHIYIYVCTFSSLKKIWIPIVLASFIEVCPFPILYTWVCFWVCCSFPLVCLPVLIHS